jgi:hypothetical protein
MELVGILAVMTIAPIGLGITLYYSWKVAP